MDAPPASTSAEDLADSLRAGLAACQRSLSDLWTARNLLERNELVSTRAFGPDMQVSEW